MRKYTCGNVASTGRCYIDEVHSIRNSTPMFKSGNQSPDTTQVNLDRRSAAQEPAGFIRAEQSVILMTSQVTTCFASA